MLDYECNLNRLCIYLNIVSEKKQVKNITPGGYNCVNELCSDDTH